VITLVINSSLLLIIIFKKYKYKINNKLIMIIHCIHNSKTYFNGNILAHINKIYIKKYMRFCNIIGIINFYQNIHFFIKHQSY